MRHESTIDCKCRGLASDHRERPSDLNVCKRREKPSSSFPEVSTNSRLLGLIPSVASFERDKSPKDGTGQLHGITLASDSNSLSRRLTRVDSALFIRRAGQRANRSADKLQPAPSHRRQIVRSLNCGPFLLIDKNVIHTTRESFPKWIDLSAFVPFVVSINLQQTYEIRPICIET